MSAKVATFLNATKKIDEKAALVGWEERPKHKNHVSTSRSH